MIRLALYFGLFGVLISVSVYMGLTTTALLGPVSLPEAKQSGIEAAASEDPREVSLSFSFRSDPGYDALYERPLFTPGRQPIEEEDSPTIEQADPPDEDPPLRASLSGIISSDRGKVVLLRPIDGSLVVQVAEGEYYEGWQLTEASSASAVFSRGSETVILNLGFTLSSPASAPD